MFIEYRLFGLKETAKVKLSDYIIDFLSNNGVKHIFEVCGGSVSHLLDSIYDRIDITTISVHHEMAAAIAAEGYSRASGKIGVAMATSGPGATNLITGIGSCFFDSIPSLFITGQVNTYESKNNESYNQVRQIGFQETDIVNIVKPIVKKATIIKDENKIKYSLEEAISIAKGGRPGPVLLDIPLNIQRANIEPDLLESFSENSMKLADNIDETILSKVIQLIKASLRPVILVGGGVRLSNAQKELETLIQMTGIPVVSSLMGLDALSHKDSSFVGMIGTYGNRYANLTIANSDLVIALGTRLDTRQTGTKPETFARGAKIIHVDIDSLELNNKIKVAFPLNLDIKVFLKRLNESNFDYNIDRLAAWKEQISHYKDKYPSYIIPSGDSIEPNYFIHILSEFIPINAIICVDVGQNQMWTAQSIKIRGSQRFLTQGGMASIGSALPMAIGASFAKPEKPILIITGDGGFQLNIQELQTVYHHNLPIKMIMLNNGCYGLIRQFQEQYFDGRFQSSVIGYSQPNFQDVVRAYKIEALKITSNSEIQKALEMLFKDRRARFLEVMIEINNIVTPKLSVNKPVEDQEPLLSRDELKLNMLTEMILSE